MERFSELKYERPDFDGLTKEMKEIIASVKNAGSYDEMKEAVLKADRTTKHMSTMYTIAHIRNTVDMTDEYYEKEMEYLDSNVPSFALVSKEMAQAFLASPFRADFEKEFGEQFSLIMNAEDKANSELIIDEKIAESRLKTEYSKLTATASIEFRGEQVNFYGLLKHMQSTDREEREEAFYKWSELYESISGRLDGIYTELVGLRFKMADKMEMPFTELGYLNKHRFEWGPEDAAKFRESVRKYIVPLVQKIRDAQAERLGLDHVCCWDEELIFPEGNAVPVGDRDYLVGKAQEMYRAISPESGEFFDFMKEHELFDLETKPGKRVGGYCTFLDEYDAPFIFSNFNGTSADADVLTHEAGHAFEAYLASKVQPISDYVWSTSEVDEIHSMSMEHFAYPYMEGFFGDKADDYRRAHLAGAVATVPYLVSVDEFQHVVYADPDLDAKGRRKAWHEIEKKYMPWRDYGNSDFLNEGGFWMQKQHIFLYPFYYIDYALAQICAFQFYLRDREDHRKAWEDYMSLCRRGGSMGCLSLLKSASLDSPFEEETVKTVAEKIEAVLGEMKMI